MDYLAGNVQLVIAIFGCNLTTSKSEYFTINSLIINYKTYVVANRGIDCPLSIIQPVLTVAVCPIGPVIGISTV